MATQIKQSLLAAGSSAVAYVTACELVISGPFSGAWRFEALIADDWQTIRSGSTPAAYTDLRFALPRQVRVTADEVLSGGINVALDGRDFQV